MKKLTKKYIFERKLDGKPIIIQIEKGYDRWTTKEDLAVLRECGIFIEYNNALRVERTITTHEILVYLIPFDLARGYSTRLIKGQILF